jgi:hypothetical protein
MGHTGGLSLLAQERQIATWLHGCKPTSMGLSKQTTQTLSCVTWNCGAEGRGINSGSSNGSAEGRCHPSMAGQKWKSPLPEYPLEVLEMYQRPLTPIPKFVSTT